MLNGNHYLPFLTLIELLKTHKLRSLVSERNICSLQNPIVGELMPHPHPFQVLVLPIHINKNNEPYPSGDLILTLKDCL